MTVASTLALLSLLFPPVSIVSSATVALVTLRLGGKEGLLVLAGGSLVAAVLSMLLSIGYQFALVYGLVLWTPIWLIAIILREGKDLVIAVEIAVLLGIAGVIGFYLYQPEPMQVWRGVLAVMVQPVLQAQPDVSAELVNRSIDTLAHYMTGAIAAGSVFGLLFGLFLARWWQANLYNPGGFRTEYLALKGHQQLAIATVLILVTALLSSGGLSEICWNLFVVLLVFYTFTGTAVMHCLISSMKASNYLLPIFYVILIAIPHFMVLVALCGLIDTRLNLRNKLKPNGG